MHEFVFVHLKSTWHGWCVETKCLTNRLKFVSVKPSTSASKHGGAAAASAYKRLNNISALPECKKNPVLSMHRSCMIINTWSTVWLLMQSKAKHYSHY